MKLDRRIILGAGLAMAAGMPANAQSYPSKPIRWIVPFPPGGNLDLTARAVGEAMSKHLGQPVVIDNRGGAGGAIGAEMVANAPADGYTILITAVGTMFVVPLWAEKKAFTYANFAPVGMLTVVPLLLEVPASSRFADWKTFIDYARANPGKISAGHAGNGTTNHIALLRLQAAEKIELNIIPYKGSGPGLNDVLAGQIDCYFDQLSSSLAHVRAGKLRALVVLSRNRAADLPDVPSLHELGQPGFDVVTHAGVVAPAATPPSVIGRLNEAINLALADPAVRQRLAGMGAQAAPMTPQQYGDLLKAEGASINALAQAGVLKPE